MTNNQIAFYKARNEKEHYERMDRETKRHNTTDEAIRSDSNVITSWFNEKQNEHLIRSDAINMAHYERMDSEQFRHNKVGESQQDIANNINYLNALSKEVEADARMKTAEASERQASTQAYLSLDPYGSSSAQAEYANIQAYYVPKYYKQHELANISQISLQDSQKFKNYTGGVLDVMKVAFPFIALGGG